jgi:ankyrin repeat protein
LAAGADPLVADFLGATPLVNAAYAGHLPVINLLLERIASEKIDVKRSLTVASVSPLHAAVLGGHREAVERLLAAGFRPTTKERAGDDPINAARRAKRSDLLELLERAN